MSIRIQDQCAGSLTSLCTTLDEVTLLHDPCNDHVCQETRIICCCMDLRLHVFKFASQGVDERISFECQPIKGTHIWDTRDNIIDLLKGLVKRGPHGESHFEELFY